MAGCPRPYAVMAFDPDQLARIRAATQARERAAESIESLNDGHANLLSQLDAIPEIANTRSLMLDMPAVEEAYRTALTSLDDG